VLRKLRTGEPASYAGRFLQFEGGMVDPPSRQPGAPAIWCGGRSDGALRRIGSLTDGWMSYVVTPTCSGRGWKRSAPRPRPPVVPFGRGFGITHLLFTRVDDTCHC
jgi:Luciferase-like monooxygenase